LNVTRNTNKICATAMWLEANNETEHGLDFKHDHID
jgi:hypothetical protein